MTKYISDAIARLTNLKNGMLKNPGKWTNPDETPEVVQGVIVGLNTAAKEIRLNIITKLKVIRIVL
ncbi:MAG: hypothetical protein M1480_10550 [Bacteroidetes bacterium]|nr:hypothetical protein [Bacteroidota bacterium]